MTIRFVQSSDNKYVQYRLTATTFSTTESDWQDAAIMGTDRIADGAVTTDKLADGKSYPIQQDCALYSPDGQYSLFNPRQLTQQDIYY